MFAVYFARRRRRRTTVAYQRFHALRWAAGRLALAGVALALTHVWAMMEFEGLSLREAVWLTMTTVMTVGYGDYAAKTPLGQASTILLLYLAGVFFAAQSAAAWFDYLASRREAMRNGQWDWSGLRDHVLVVAPGRVGELYLLRLLSEMDEQARLRGCEVVVVSDEFPDGLPGAVATSHARLITGHAQDPEALQRAAAANAKCAFVLADNPDTSVSDGITYDVVSRLREQNAAMEILAECVDDRNRGRLLKDGASVVVRPIRAYPEMTVTALMHPGSSDILENLVSAAGESIELVQRAFSGTWKALVGESLERGEGLPLAVRLKDGTIVTAPPADRQLDAVALYILRSADRSG